MQYDLRSYSMLCTMKIKQIQVLLQSVFRQKFRRNYLEPLAFDTYRSKFELQINNFIMKRIYQIMAISVKLVNILVFDLLLLPQFSAEAPKITLISLYCVFGLIVFALFFLASYINTCCTNNNLVNDRIAINGEAYCFCQVCNLEIDDGEIKHCLICGCCIDGFLYHCPWINNCVGKKNVTYFCIYVLSLFLFLLYYLLISIMAINQSCDKNSNGITALIVIFTFGYSLTLYIVILVGLKLIKQNILEKCKTASIITPNAQSPAKTDYTNRPSSNFKTAVFATPSC